MIKMTDHSNYIITFGDIDANKQVKPGMKRQ
jgi:hypothetical protein